MKLLPLLVAVAVVALTAGTIWVGARVREDTVVAHPYEEGLAYDQQRKAMAPAGHGGHHAPAAGAAASGQGEGAQARCDLGAGPCALSLGGAELTLELGPRPLAALRALAIEATLRAGGAPVEGAELTVSFAMPGMEMGKNEVRLAPAGAGRYRGEAVLVRCLSGRRDWEATVALRRGGQEAQAALPVGLGK